MTPVPNADPHLAKGASCGHYMLGIASVGIGFPQRSLETIIFQQTMPFLQAVYGLKLLKVR